MCIRDSARAGLQKGVVAAVAVALTLENEERGVDPQRHPGQQAGRRQRLQAAQRRRQRAGHHRGHAGSGDHHDLDDPAATPDRHPPAPPRVAPAHAEIVSFEVAHLTDDKVPLLTHPDLVVTMRARVAGAERPNFGLMIEQLHGVGITSITTHSDGVEPVRKSDGLRCATETLPPLPAHSSEDEQTPETVVKPIAIGITVTV